MLLILNYEKSRLQKTLNVKIMRRPGLPHLDQRSPPEEEAEQVGHDVVADDDGDRDNEPGDNREIIIIEEFYYIIITLLQRMLENRMCFIGFLY